MPDQISAWWLVGGMVGTLVCNAFGFGWWFRGMKQALSTVAKDAAEAVALARQIRDVDLLGIRREQAELTTAVSLSAARIKEIDEEHAEMVKLVKVDLPQVVAGAIERAANAASKSAWHRRKR